MDADFPDEGGDEVLRAGGAQESREPGINDAAALREVRIRGAHAELEETVSFFRNAIESTESEPGGTG